MKRTLLALALAAIVAFGMDVLIPSGALGGDPGQGERERPDPKDKPETTDNEMTIQVGETQRHTIGRGQSVTKVTSSDEEIVKVSIDNQADGAFKVTGVQKGTATVEWQYLDKAGNEQRGTSLKVTVK